MVVLYFIFKIIHSFNKILSYFSNGENLRVASFGGAVEQGSSIYKKNG
jgi:hypothetical protein